MGTNYYIRKKECKHCDRYEEIHLGKSSFGWQFTFQYNEGEYYRTVEGMKKWLKGKQIWNEYDEKISKKKFWDMIESKKDGFNHADKCPDDHKSFKVDGYSFTDCEFS